MLVLSRKTGEQLLIGDDIVITIVRVTDNNVRLGIDAPRQVNVARGELVKPVEQEPALPAPETQSASLD